MWILLLLGAAALIFGVVPVAAVLFVIYFLYLLQRP